MTNDTLAHDYFRRALVRKEVLDLFLLRESFAAKKIVSQFLGQFPDLLNSQWGDDLLAVIQFGSTARGPLKRETDLDLLIVRKDFPATREMRRQLEEDAESLFARSQEELQRLGYAIDLSPLVWGESRFRSFSKLYLDMSGEGVICYDKTGLAAKVMERTRSWMKETGVERVQKGLKWYWRLNKTFKPGDVFEVGFGQFRE